MARFSTAARRVGVTALLVSAAALGSVTAAEASPGSCSVSASGSGSFVTCKTGTGEFRASTRCRVDTFPDYNAYGQWVKPGQYSEARCWKSKGAFNQGFQTR